MIGSNVLCHTDGPAQQADDQLHTCPENRIKPVDGTDRANPASINSTNDNGCSEMNLAAVEVDWCYADSDDPFSWEVSPCFNSNRVTF